MEGLKKRKWRRDQNRTPGSWQNDRLEVTQCSELHIVKRGGKEEKVVAVVMAVVVAVGSKQDARFMTPAS